MAQLRPKTLSDFDPIYKEIAMLQKAICDLDPTHRCDVPSFECAINLDRSLARQKPDRGDASKGERETLVTEICAVRGPPYEIHGYHWLLQRRLDQVKQAAKKAEITFDLWHACSTSRLPFRRKDLFVVPESASL
jgi:hypothetical protein